MINNLLDAIDSVLCKSGFLTPADWEKVRHAKPLKLYAGRLPRDEPQFQDHFGLAYKSHSLRNIKHDLTQPLPLGENTVDHFQSQDVFEHIAYDLLFNIIEDIYRVLKPGGLFRLSVPDYRSPLYHNRSLRDKNGNIIFDPGGGGKFEDGKVTNGGHVWFPRFETVKSLLDRSSFATYGRLEYLHYIDPHNRPVMNEIDHSNGLVRRTPDFDERAKSPKTVLSIVVDAWKNDVNDPKFSQN